MTQRIFLFIVLGIREIKEIWEIGKTRFPDSYEILKIIKNPR